MKKLFTTPAYKLYNKRHALNSFHSKLRFKAHRKKTNKSNNFKHRKYRKSKKVRYIYVTAPEQFSFLKNPLGVLNFIQTLEGLLSQKKEVFIVMQDVKEVTYDAIVVLLSVMVLFRLSHIEFDGDFPREKKPRQIVIDSGFLQSLYSMRREGFKIKKPNLIFRGRKKVDSGFSANVLDDVGKKLWDQPKRFQGANRVLIELMQNTHNHADPSDHGKKHWWLSVNHDTILNSISFSFVDYGVGIFKSLDNKPQDSKFYGLVNQLKRTIEFGDNAKLLELILDGELHKIATSKEEFHGKGLPCIKKAMERNQISNLYIISDNVFADISKENYTLLDNSFSGTFIYWELTKNNVCSNGSYKNQNS